VSDGNREGGAGNRPEEEPTAMIDYRIQLFWSEEDGRYVADIPELAPCTAFGATAEEALAKVEALKSAWLRPGRSGTATESRDLESSGTAT